MPGCTNAPAALRVKGADGPSQLSKRVVPLRILLAVQEQPMQIDFWFTMGSTYSYLSVMRLHGRKGNITFRWRPFHLLIILQEMNHVPFADKPAKMTYMWRDVARRAEMYGIPARLPVPYPAKQSIAANLVALVGMQEGWGVDFVCAAYRNWFQRGEETGSEPNLSHSLGEVGQD